MSWFRLVGGIAALVLGGCAGLFEQSSAGPAAAPAGLRTLRFGVDERVAIVTEGSIGAGFDRTLRSALETEMARAGLQVADASAADVTLKLEARVEGGAGLLRGRGSLTVVRAGEEIDVLSADEPLVRERQFPESLARQLVSQLVVSPRLQSLARPPVATTSAPPQAEAVDSARQHARQGTSLYNLDRFDEALAAYQSAYLAAPDPALLFNIAQCQRRLGRRTEALDYYRKYLRSAPKAANRGEVERRIRELDPPGRSRR